MDVKKKIIRFVLMFILVVIFYIFGVGMNKVGSFNKHAWSDRDFKNIVMNEIDSVRLVTDEKTIINNVVGLKVELPDVSLSDAILTISSEVAGGYVYVGPYEKIIRINATQNMLKNEHPEYDGYDMLDISFVDVKNKITYTCMQEKLYKIWEKNKIATVNFFESRRADKNGQPQCYSVHISGDL